MQRAGPISRAELLGGFQGGDRRRAGVALSLIEARAARFALDREMVNVPLMTESAMRERSRAYLGAFADSARSTVQVSIQDIERSVDAWRALVPASAAIRAEIARRLGDKYRFTARQIPNIVAALGLSEPAVQTAFEASGAKSLSTIYQPDLGMAERIKWAWSRLSGRLESLPPFWTAFALTITEIVGAGTLALPIAFAKIGAAAGVAVLVIIGIVNLLTVSYLVEASARNSSIRYGSAFVGKMVSEYLGPWASVLLRLALFAYCCMILASYYTGFASTLSAVTGLADQIWVGVLCAVGLFLILRRSLVGTVASALIIGMINIGILLILSVIAFSHATAENLLRVDIPIFNGRSFEATDAHLIFGVVLVSYFGHLSVSNCAQAVLRRDPDGHSLKSGTIAAMIVAIVIYCIWTLGVGGAIDGEVLHHESGTALGPLTTQLGAEVYVLGAAFAVLGLGMSSIHYALGIFNIAHELISNLKINGPAWLGGRVARVLSLLPILLIFAYVQWTYATGDPSFASPLGLLGAILAPVLAGIFPVLLLLSSRARGLVADGARVSGAASNRIVLSLVMVFSFAGMLLHGIFVWNDPFPRATALVVAAIMLGLMVSAYRRRVFAPAMQVEIRYFPESGHKAQVAMNFGGKAVDANVMVRQADGGIHPLARNGLIDNFTQCVSLEFDLPQSPAVRVELKADEISGNFEAQPLEGTIIYMPGVEQASGGESDSVSLDTASGRTSLVTPRVPWRAQLKVKLS